MHNDIISVNVPRSFFSSVRDKVRDVHEAKDIGWLTALRVGRDGLRDLVTIAEHEKQNDPVAAEAAAMLELRRFA